MRREELALKAAQQHIELTLTEHTRDLLTGVIQHYLQSGNGELCGCRHRLFVSFEPFEGMGVEVRLGIVHRPVKRVLQIEQTVTWRGAHHGGGRPVEELFKGIALHGFAFLLRCNV